MLSKADDYPIHQTPEPIAYAGSDRNFYDRYFFNGYSDDGELFFTAAHGVYPHLNIMDAAFAVRIGEVQYNLHASRHMNMERMDTHVGPIRVEVLEPLQRLRVSVDHPEHGIAADLVFEGRFAPIEEPRSIRRNGPRMVMDCTRLTQLGRWSGWLRAGGQEVRFEDRVVHGTRDRSWGVRPVGERDPQAAAPAQEPQVLWYWTPGIFQDRAMLFYVSEDGDGVAWNKGMMIRRDDGELAHLDGAELEVTLQPGSRWPSRAVIQAPDGRGGRYRVEIEPGAKFFLSGIGYMNPEWGHGMNKGPLAVGYDEMRMQDAVRSAPPYHHVQAFARLTLTTPQGETLPGVGILESLCIGRYAPLGLTSLYDSP